MPTENNPMKSAIDRRLSALCVPDDMAQRIQAAAQKKRPRVIRFRRPLAVAAVFCLILACSMGVLATTVPSVQNLFAIVGTQISSMLQPIERSCTDNGIETDQSGGCSALRHCHDADGADGPVRRKNCDSHLPH